MNSGKKSFREYIKSFITWDFLIMILIFILGDFSNRMGTTPITTQAMELGIAGTMLGLLISMSKIIQMFMRPVSASFFDRISSKKALCFGYLATAVAYLFYGIGQNSTMFFIAKVLQGISNGLLGGLAYSMLVKKVGFGSFGMAVAIVTALSDAATGYATLLSKQLFERISFFAAYGVAALLTVGTAGLCLLLSNDKDDAKKLSELTDPPRVKEKFKFKDLLSGICVAVLPICTLGLFANCTRELFLTYTVQLGIERGIDSATGIAMAAVTMAWVGFVVGFLIDRINAELVLLASYCFMGISNLLYGLGNTLLVYTIAAFCLQIGMGAYFPALQATCFKVAGKDQEGAVSQTLYMFLDFVAIVFASVVGVMYDQLGLTKIYVIMGIVNLFAVVYYLGLKKIYLNKYMEKHSL